jgi:predicted protein tyrosine phosphatase
MASDDPASMGGDTPFAPAGWEAEFTWLTDTLAVGGRFPTGVAERMARDHGVGAVVDLRLEERDEEEELRACGIAFLHLPTEDVCAVSQPMLDDGVAFARRAEAAGLRLLLHCQHGIGRSALLALCVLVDRGFDPIDALKLAKDARERISPSPPQYEAWADWLRRHGRSAPSFDAYAGVAYRHLHRSA